MGTKNGGGEIGAALTELSKLKTQKGGLIDEKKVIRAQLDGFKTQADKLVKDRKDTKSNIKFSTVEQIDAEVAKLVKLHETTSMSLQEEKRIIKEIDTLKASKSLVKDLKSKETSLDDIKEQRKNITTLITAKDKEIDAVQSLIDTASKALDALRGTQTSKNDALKILFSERDEFKVKMTETIKKKDTCRTVFREANNSWYNFQRAVKAQKQLKYLGEKKAREEAQIEWQKKKPEDFARSHPGGALGRKLLTHVSDVMRSGDQVPSVALNASFSELMREVSSKGLGASAVVDGQGRVLGIFTDGDLRRLVETGVDLRSLTANDVMHAKPRTVLASDLAVEAVAVMEQHRITSVLVVDAEGKLCGAINSNDLLRAKVI